MAPDLKYPRPGVRLKNATFAPKQVNQQHMTRLRTVFCLFILVFLSPALVAEYRTQLPDKQLLAAKLHEFYALSAPAPETMTHAVPPPRRRKRGKA